MMAALARRFAASMRSRPIHVQTSHAIPPQNYFRRGGLGRVVPHSPSIVNSTRHRGTDWECYSTGTTKSDPSGEVIQSRVKNGVLAFSQARYQDAVREFTTVLELLEDDGTDSPSIDDTNRDKYVLIAEALGNLGVTLKRLGPLNLEEALSLQQRSLNIRRHLWEPLDARIAVTLHNIALLKMDLGWLDEAQSDATEAINILNNGPAKHPATLGGLMNTMGSISVAMKEVDKAIEYYTKSLSLLSGEADSKPSQDTSPMLNNLMCLYIDQDNYSKAREYGRKAVDVSEAIRGKQHPHTSMYKSRLAGVEEALGNFEAARELHKRSWDMVQRFFPGTIEGASIAFNYATFLSQHPKYDTAEGVRVAQMSVSWWSAILGYEGKSMDEVNDDRFADALFVLGRCHVHADNLDLAEECLSHSIHLVVGEGGERNEQILERARLLVEVMRKRGKSEQVKDLEEFLAQHSSRGDEKEQ